MDYQAIYDFVMGNPILSGGVLGFAAGLALIWKATVRAVIRALEKIAPDHTGDEQELVQKVRQFQDNGMVESMMTTMVPTSTIQKHAKIRAASIVPPGADK